MGKKPTYQELKDLNERLKERIKFLEKSIKELETDRTDQAEFIAESHSPEIFFKAFHSNPALMAISNFRNTAYIDVNKAFLDALGYEREEIIGRTSADLQLFVNIVQQNKFLSDLQKRKKVRDHEVKIKTKSGDQRIGLFSAETIMLNDEPCLLTIINDITERKKAERILRQAESRYKLIFENMSNCVAVYQAVDKGKDFVFLEFNAAAEKVEKISAGEVIGRRITDVFPAVKEFGFFDSLKRVYKTGESEILPISFYKDGRISGWRKNLVYKLPTDEIVAIYEDYTELKRQEENLKRSEQRFREFAELFPAIVCEATMAGHLSYANSFAVESFGYTKEEVRQGIIFDDLLTPAGFRKARFQLLRQIKGEKIDAFELTAVRKDRSTFPALAYVDPILENKKPVGFRGVMFDLTSQKKAQEELQTEKALLEHLIESAPEGIVQTDNRGKLLRMNSEFVKLFGYTKKETIGKELDKLISSGNLLKEAQRTTNSIASGKTVSMEAVRKRKDGTLIDVSLLGTPVIIKDKQIGIFGIYRDISERKRIERVQQLIYEISKAVHTTENLDQLFQIIKEQLSTIMDTKNFFIALYNKETDSLTLPFFRDEKDQFDSIPAGKTLTAYVIRQNKPVLADSILISELEEKGEVELVGTPCKVWLGVPLRAEDEIVGVISLQSYDDENAFSERDLQILQFISSQAGLSIDRKRAEQNLIIAKQKAEEAAMAKQQFLSTMSHEIRTPLNAVIGMTHLLFQENPREDQLEYLNALKFSGENLLVLINDILDFSKIDAGKVFFEEISFSIKELINGIKQTFIYRTEEKGLKLMVMVDAGIADYVLGDSTRLNQVLTNLIGNAIKFTEKGSVKIEIKLVKETNRLVEIEFSVQDTGIGIPADKLEYIFDSFTQAGPDTTRKYGGTGLGLAISKKLLELQNSDLMIESTPGKGSRFFFQLTFKKSPEKSTQVLTMDLEEKFDQLKGKRILHVEDNEVNQIVAEKLLVKKGIQVDHAGNGKEALEKLTKNNYDLILMDLHMPEMNGYEAAKAIRVDKDPKISSIPIIAITASVMMEVQEQVQECGMNDFILKPFNPYELYQKILVLLI